MNGTRDTRETAAADDGSGFEPRETAALFEQTRRQARRQSEINPTWLWLVRAAVIAVLGYTAVTAWLRRG